ncbi:MAG: fibronectin type III domain-containing protein [Bacillota bacterium]|nr:fibronectin type III domain-containing protein [Bacillota bacterium]
MKNTNLKGVLVFAAAIIAIFSMLVLSTELAEAKISDKNKETYANIVMFAYFSDDSTESENLDHGSEQARDKVISIFDGDYGRSFKGYMNKISYGKLEVVNILPQDNGKTIEWYKLSMPASQQNDTAIINELVGKVPGIQDKTVDYNNDGYIDNLTVVLKCDKSSNIVSHKSDYPGSLSYCGKNVGTYNILNSYNLIGYNTVTSFGNEGGLIAHEFMHSLGYPDLYENGEESTYPVHVWDIMAYSSPYQSYPLAYMRKHFFGWIDIDTITENKTGLRLDEQSNQDGNQAFVLKSPLDDTEFFVAEFRKKPEGAAWQLTDALDTKIGGSGIIVYRINTKVEKLSNHFGETGVYVFRPQPGQNGYTEAAGPNAMQAFLSKESGRTSIGSSDLSKGLEDGALTFSNGTNSGIVISNISSAAGESMTFDVSIPDAAELDMWQDTGFAQGASTDSGIMMTSMTCDSSNKLQYLMTYSAGSFKAYKFDGSSWTPFGNTIDAETYSPSLKTVYAGGKLYFAYISDKYELKIMQYDPAADEWKTAGSIQDVGNSFDMIADNGKLYIAAEETGSGYYNGAALYRLEGESLKKLNSYCSSGLYGQPYVAVVKGTVYVSARNASGNVIEVYRYDDASSAFCKITNGEMAAGTYSMTEHEGKLCIAAGGDDLTVSMYDGNSWHTGSSSGISCMDPQAVSIKGKLYVMLSMEQSGKGNLRVYSYDSAKDSFDMEGTDVDSAAEYYAIAPSPYGILASYVDKTTGSIKVKRRGADDVMPDVNETVPEEKPEIKPDAATETKPAAGTVVKPFRINPAKTSLKSVKKGRRSFTARWSRKTAQVTGYQLQYSTSSKFSAKKTRSKYIKKNKTVSVTIKKLKSGKKYYVRIRTYKKIGKITYYSGWSKARTVRVK